MSVWVFDTETTSKEADREIIEAAWIDVGDDFKEVIDFATKGCVRRFKPDRPITYGSMAVHHILPRDLNGMEPSSSFEIPEHVRYLIGHNIDFDWESAGSPAHCRRICTDAMSRHIWPEADSHSQSALLYMLVGATQGMRDRLREAHSALTDARNNMTLLSYILQRRPEITTFEDLWKFSEEARVPTVCPFKKHKGTPLIEVLHIDPGFFEWMEGADFIDSYLREGLRRARESYYEQSREQVASFEEWTEDDLPF